MTDVRTTEAKREPLQNLARWGSDFTIKHFASDTHRILWDVEVPNVVPIEIDVLILVAL